MAKVLVVDDLTVGYGEGVVISGMGPLMFAAMAALNRRKTTLNPTTSGICLMIGSLLTRAAESNVRQGVALSRKSAGPKPRAL